MNILITGGGRGLGKLIVERLNKLNNSIVILDCLPFSQTNLDQLKNISYHEIDLVDFEEVNKILDEVIKKFGIIDVFINNAALREFHSFEKFSNDEIVRNIKVNFEIPLLILKKLLPLMIENNFGRIINISSISGLSGYSSGTLYCSTKSAINIFTESLADDFLKLKRNVTVNAILPGAFQTREGEKLKHYKYITEKIITNICKTINSNINGKLYIVIPFNQKIYTLLKIFLYHIKRIK